MSLIIFILIVLKGTTKRKRRSVDEEDVLQLDEVKCRLCSFVIMVPRSKFSETAEFSIIIQYSDNQKTLD